MKKLNYKAWGMFFFGIAIAGFTYFATYKYYQREIEFGKENSQLLDVAENVEKKFYLDVDKQEMTYNMIAGLVNGLDDFYSSYKTWNVWTENDVNNSITLKSSGFRIDKHKTGNILVTSVESGSQAEKMGLKSGDIITAIDGINVLETGYYNIISELMGKDLTVMNLNVQRSENELLEIEFTRRNIIENYSEYSWDIIDNVFYYRFNVFNDSTIENFQNSVENFQGKKLIFDLRKNTGGITEECIRFFDLFSDSGNALREVYSKTGEEIIYETFDGVEYDFDVVVLISEETLSSGEIFTQLLKENDVVAIGEKTGGKGVFQEKIMLDDMSSYAMVCGYYYINDNPNYNNIGISPDIEIKMDNSLIGTADDIQLKKAIEIVNDMK